MKPKKGEKSTDGKKFAQTAGEEENTTDSKGVAAGVTFEGYPISSTGALPAQ